MKSTMQRMSEGASEIYEWLGEGGKPVPRTLAQHRADICLQCPHNKSTGQMTLQIAKAVKSLIAIKNRMKVHVDGEKKLGQCDICLCQLRLKVHAPLSEVRKEIVEDEKSLYPGFCWQISEIET